MAAKEFKPYVPAETSLREFTFKAVFVGMIMSIVLGAANAYLGLKAGMTVAATFPAAVIAMAALRPFKGTILEENICRTTAAVGEALVAGAIFTIPAFLLAGVWTTLKYWESTALMLIGGVLGVLFVIFLRRILIEDTTLPFPESVACAEIVKAGQKGQTGASYVFGALGLAALIEFFKNSSGVQLFRESVGYFFKFSKSKIQMLTGGGAPLGKAGAYGGGVFLRTPAASPALIGVGYIIGPRLASIVFSGGVLGWLLLVPLLMFIDRNLTGLLNYPLRGDVGYVPTGLVDIANSVWFSQVRPLAVGAMLVGAFYTLFTMRKSLTAGIARAIRDMRKVRAGEVSEVSRLEKDLPYNWVVFFIIALVIPIGFIYYHFCQSVGGAIVAAIVMTIAGFLFAAVAGYLVGLIGSSNNPISGLTLSTLIVAALLMVLIGVKGSLGIAAVLGVAAVVCCSSGVAGDIMQDLKVGHILGGTPWKMEIGVILGVIAAALVMVVPLNILHQGTPGGIGGPELPAPQAGLMAMLSKGIVGGEMAWPLVFVGMVLSIGLILIKAPSPMLIAVGMYLPFQTTAAIFVGGIIKYIVQVMEEKRGLSAEAKERVDNTGILLASGFIAGEALTGIVIAALVVAGIELPSISTAAWPGLIVFGLLAYLLTSIPLKRAEGE
ncbi:MAG: oligopeptide transporter, OPT family [Acidobacteria bacterium]|nr:oligopeptide transporter, OPT family [Acidobacteriota bacterium]